MAPSPSKLILISIILSAFMAGDMSSSAGAATSGGGGNANQGQSMGNGGNVEGTARRPLTRTQRRQNCFNGANAWFQRAMDVCATAYPPGTHQQEFEECMDPIGMQYNREIRACQRI